MTWRVRRRSEFELLRREGRAVREGRVVAVHVSDPSLVPPRLAFAVPRSVGSAVSRNRVRRVLKADAASHPPPAGLTLVRVRPGAASIGADELRRQQRAAFARLGEQR